MAAWMQRLPSEWGCPPTNNRRTKALGERLESFLAVCALSCLLQGYFSGMVGCASRNDLSW